MSAAPSTRIVYRFGVFEANPQTGELQRKGVRVKLQEQPFQLLTFLLENAGEVLSRDSVRQRLWPGNTFVDFDASLSVAVGKLRDSLGDDADSPRFIETIPRRGYRFIAPVERILQARPMATASPSAIESSTRVDPAALEPARPKNSLLTVGHILVIGLVGVALAGTVVYRSLRRLPQATAEAKTSQSAPQIRRSVAVLGFRNLPGRKDDEWLSQAFTEMLGTELAAGGNLRLVSDEDVARSKRELMLGDQETLAKPTLERLRSNPGADVVVVGSYTPLPGRDQDRIRLDVRVQDTSNGETIAEDAVTGSKEDLFEIATRAGQHLRKSLGVIDISPDSANAVRASLPANQAAVRFYSEGKAKLWVFDFVGARDLLAKAVKADPDYPLAHASLADAWWHLGYSAKATAEAKRAIELSASLAEEERLRIEGSYQATIGDWPKAVEAYRALFRLHPDDLESGLKLAGSEYHVKIQDALATLRTLRQLPAPAGDDPRIDLLEASAQVTQDLTAAQAAARRAVAKGNAQGSPLMVARAYGILCQQGSSIGSSTEQSISDCENARQGYAAAGDANNEARTLSDLAGIFFQRGDLVRAEAMWRKAEKQFKQTGDAAGLAVTSNNIGDVFILEGKLPDAKKFLEQAFTGYRILEDKDGMALVLNDLGDIELEQGNLSTAESKYQQAKSTASEISDKTAVAYVLSGLGNVLKYRGDLAAARESYQESLALRTQAGEKQMVAETEVSLALLSIEDGHPDAAETSLRKSIAQFHAEKQTDDELLARIGLIRALLAQRQDANAASEIQASEPLAAKSLNLTLQLEFDLVAARARSAVEHPEAARAKFEAILKNARAHGFTGVEFDTRLALAEWEMRSGKSFEAFTQLAALERAASAKGYGLIARKAAAARS